jgi:hypothetical protein
MVISNVRGLNDNAALKSPTSFVGNCATCHDTPNIGNHSLPLPLDIGTGHLADANFESDPLISAAVGQLSMPGLQSCQGSDIAGARRPRSLFS